MSRISPDGRAAAERKVSDAREPVPASSMEVAEAKLLGVQLTKVQLARVQEAKV
jgi:hypothetical protein